MNMHVIRHEKCPLAVRFPFITVKVFRGIIPLGLGEPPISLALCMCAVPFPLVDATKIGLLEVKRVDLYERLMIWQKDIRVTGVLTHSLHGHCVEEKCRKLTAKRASRM